MLGSQPGGQLNPPRPTGLHLTLSPGQVVVPLSVSSLLTSSELTCCTNCPLFSEALQSSVILKHTCRNIIGLFKQSFFLEYNLHITSCCDDWCSYSIEGFFFFVSFFLSPNSSILKSILFKVQYNKQSS